MLDIKDRINGVITGLAIGDALGHLSVSTGKPVAELSLDDNPVITYRTLSPLAILNSLPPSFKTEEEESLQKKMILELGKISNQPEACLITNLFIQEQKTPSFGLLKIDSNSPIFRSIPMGIIFSKDIPSLIGLSRTCCDISHCEDRCHAATIAGNMMVANSVIQEIPIGMWCDAISFIIGGVDNSLLAALDLATNMAGDGIDPVEAFSKMESGKTAGGLLSRTLFSCIAARGRFDKALEIASLSDPDTMSYVGAIMGGFVGFEALPVHNRNKVAFLDPIKAFEPKIIKTIIDNES